MSNINQEPIEEESSVPDDLPDSEHDKEIMKEDEIIMDLPDVEDIPGQENIHPLIPAEMADTTIASDDEEGVDLFGRDADEQNARGTEDEDAEQPEVR